MKREAVIIKKSKDGKRCIAVDADNAEALLAFFNQNDRFRTKFDFITDIILGNHKNREVYDKEEPDKQSKGVRAMKFFKGQENARVYCKEVTMNDKTFVIIASELIEKKKTDQLTYKEKQVIKKVAGYEYEEIE